LKTALVIGGTGPTGPFIVDGLIDRGYAVTIFHSGFHEVEFKQPVEHLHNDPHFRETFEAAIGKRSWDVVVFSYGRLQLAAELLRGRTGRLIALGGATGSAAAAHDPAWGAMGRHANIDEASSIPETDVARNKFGYRMAQAEAALFQAHHDGHYNATYIGYPILYGPRQPGPQEWSIVRRVLDRRAQFIIADGGIKLESRAYVENAAHATLLALDQPERSAGRKYFVADEKLYSMRQRIEAIARYLKHEFEFVDLPYELALPCHVLWRFERANRIREPHRIREELGYRDVVSAEEGMRRTVDGLVSDPPAPESEAAIQLGDPFDYAREDRLIRDWTEWRKRLPAVDYPVLPPAHIYRHPKQPNEPWQRPSRRV
jgi:nucleoside-diphosphate-sugar epimerase